VVSFKNLRELLTRVPAVEGSRSAVERQILSEILKDTKARVKEAFDSTTSSTIRVLSAILTQMAIAIKNRDVSIDSFAYLLDRGGQSARDAQRQVMELIEYFSALAREENLL